MGNAASAEVSLRRRQGSRRSHPPPPPEIARNHLVYPNATPYPAPYPLNAGYYQYPAGYYPPPPPPGAVPVPLPAPYDHHHQVPHGNWAGRGHVCGPVMGPAAPYVEHQKAVTIRNDVNLKKETIRVVPDEENPGKYLVGFTFDATTDGSITILFFTKESEDSNLAPTKETVLPPVKLDFKQGLGQKFLQPSGTGIDFSMFQESELLKETDTGIYPLVVKADACLDNEAGDGENQTPGSTNSQITQAVFEREKGEYRVKVVKQILWVNGVRYELREIFGIGHSVEGDFDENDPGKECVICLSEPRDTTVLPCRHMCMCSGCAKVLRFQTNRCPICRQPVERLLEIKVSSNVNSDD